MHFKGQNFRYLKQLSVTNKYTIISGAKKTGCHFFLERKGEFKGTFLNREFKGKFLIITFWFNVIR